ncbi:signal transduction histidine kinase [Nocardioides ginsengisegetis]|uniref:Signal transduction histidine kinase n=1 Tax=Nocardioides ginsengisegetis TaxID=661491 RepID=A0A7W3J0D1_9ACTN|nr:signal transduction histidine kinase [Nocardioides ginsengisegetis]
MTSHDRQFLRLSAVARGFVLVALVAPVLWSRDSPALVALAAVGAVWVLGTLAQARSGWPVMTTSTLEAATIGSICGFSIHTSLAVLGALAVPPFVAALRLGWRGMLLALSAELVAVVAIPVAAFGALTGDQAFGAFTWCMTGLGMGLIAGFVHATLEQENDPLAPYHYAQALIRELIDLSGGLSSGLEPVALGGVILSAVRDDLPAESTVLYVPRGDSLTPLITKSASDTDALGGAAEELAVEAWALSRPLVDGGVFAFPLVSEAGTIAVVAGVLSDRVDLKLIALEQKIAALSDRLAASAVHLDTALLFASFRDAATAEERRRLAREMHDGVAQDIASLGYLVDALAARAGSPEQAARIAVLRERITAVVAEVRRSVLTLRTTVGTSESLGTAIGAIARNLTEVSHVPIHVTLDERTTRLRPEVEAELFRIAQEAMTNAVRHAHATRIDVHCQVHAPAATITVTDDGLGLQQARSDSHGLEIMHERALLIGAHLTITDREAGGAAVTVRIPEQSGDPSSVGSDNDAIVGA